MYKVSNRYIKCKRSWYLFKHGCFRIHLHNKLPSIGLSFCKNFPVNNVLTGSRAHPRTPSYTPGSRAEGAGRITPLPFLLRRHLSAYFPSCCCLRVQLLTSLPVGADCGPCLWTLPSGHSFNHQDVLGTQVVAWTITKVIGVWASLIDKAPLLHKPLKQD